MIDMSELKRGLLLEMDGAPWLVLDCNFQSPSARGASTIAKIKVRNLKTGAVLSKAFRSGDQIASADCERRPVQFLYKQQDTFVFMDAESYEQSELDRDSVGDAAGFLLDGMEATAMLYNGEVINIELPHVVELVVTDTPPAIKNSTAQAQTKQATLETGLVIDVPAYLTTGETVKVDTRDGRYVGRVKG